jgi:hypothetical protein
VDRRRERNEFEPAREEVKVMRRRSWLLGKGQRISQSILRGGRHALDNFCDFAGDVALGTGHLLHLGWIRPHPVGVGRRGSHHQSSARPESCLMEATQK